MKTLI
jgi:hypothetical protein